MTFALGIFDLFTYGIPGALQLALLTYVAARLGWLDASLVADVPPLALGIGAAVVSYLLGHCMYGLGTLMDRVSPPWKRYLANFRATFVERVPGAKGRPFVQADLILLLAAADLQNRDAAGEITRMRAVGLMLRNAGVAMLLAAVVALVEVAVGPDRLEATAVTAVLVLAFYGSLVQSAVMRKWANFRTLELCYWIPGIDDKLVPPGSRVPPADTPDSLRA